VPIGGIIPLSPSLDHAGPMARSLADCAVVLTAMAAGGAEPTALMPPPAPLGELPTRARASLEGVTVALTERTERLGAEPDVVEGLERARAACEELGARVVELEAAPELSPEDFTVVFLSEVWAYHHRHAELADRYRAQIAEMVHSSQEFTVAGRYMEAQAARDAITAGWEDWFARNGVDVLLEPTVPMPAEERGTGYDAGKLAGEGDPLIRFTGDWDSVGFPVATLSAGLGSRSGMPVGVSLIAPRGAEATVVQVGIDLQEHALPPLEPVAP
jgi:aspartyl-tRNA(Asn)/glutamyl-tRNA(Gln) amidotransferase subunit A